MKYVIYNIRNLAGREKFIFAIMLVCVFVSAWILTFSYGLYENYHALSVEDEETGKTAKPHIVGDNPLTYGEFKAFLETLPSELLNSAESIMCRSSYHYESAKTPGEMNSELVYSRFTIKNGNYQVSSYIADMWKSDGMISTGRFFSDEDEMFGNDYVMVDNRTMNDKFAREQYANLIIDDNTVFMYGKEYKVIGTHTRPTGL